MHNCPICFQETKDLLTEELRRGKGKVFYCKNCDLGFLEKKIDNVKEYYDKEYRKEYSHKAEVSDTNADEMFNIYKNYQSSRLKVLEKYKGNADTILEIGASAGQFLYHLKDSFRIINAIELDSNCCQYLKSKFDIDSDSSFLEDSKFNKRDFYDIVCSFQVLEHSINPIEFLENIYKVLKKGGKLIIEVPNLYDPLLSVWNVSNYNSFYYHSAHNFYFSETTLKKIAEASNFKILEIIYSQDYNLLNHINWILNNQPQANCEIGLNPPHVNGKDLDISNWLNEELKILNEKYFEKLIKNQKTSNIVIVLEK